MDPITHKIPLKSFDLIYRNHRVSKVKNWFIGTMLLLIVVLFLPWTQNIKSKGNITTLRQEQRPQDIVSPIPGKIVKWWIKEGDFVKKGDTILQLTEIKEEYLDPNLVNRTKEQLEAKKGTIEYYRGKVGTAKTQIEALTNSRILKIEQLKNKLQQLENKLTGEKAELQAAANDFELSKDQFNRQQKMYNEGLVSQTQLQQRNVATQNALSKKIGFENKIAQTQQEIINVQIEQNSVQQDYAEKISKAEGDKLQSLSMAATGKGEVAKLENQVVNYTIRNGMYILLAPQNGQFVQAKKSGLGEIVKEGEIISTIVPEKTDYAVEMFVRPIDLPLISKGQKVRFTARYVRSWSEELAENDRIKPRANSCGT